MKKLLRIRKRLSGIGGVIQRNGSTVSEAPEAAGKQVPLPLLTISRNVQELRIRLIELARNGKLHCGLQTEFGYWKPEPFRSAKVVPVSTWALQAQKIGSCFVCGKSLDDAADGPRGRCDHHADWEIVWVHYSWSGKELNNSMVEQLQRIVNKYEVVMSDDLVEGIE